MNFYDFVRKWPPLLIYSYQTACQWFYTCFTSIYCTLDEVKMTLFCFEKLHLSVYTVFHSLLRAVRELSQKIISIEICYFLMDVGCMQFFEYGLKSYIGPKYLVGYSTRWRLKSVFYKYYLRVANEVFLMIWVWFRLRVKYYFFVF